MIALAMHTAANHTESAEQLRAAYLGTCGPGYSFHEMRPPTPLMPACAGTAATRSVTPVGFEPTQLALVELESTPLDHLGKVS